MEYHPEDAAILKKQTTIKRAWKLYEKYNDNNTIEQTDNALIAYALATIANKMQDEITELEHAIQQRQMQWHENANRRLK